MSGSPLTIREAALFGKHNDSTKDGNRATSWKNVPTGLAKAPLRESLAAASRTEKKFPNGSSHAGLFPHAIAGMLGYWPGDVMGFGGRQPLALVRDWSQVVRTGQYQSATGTFDYEASLPRYRGDILAINITGDVLAPRSATDALLTKAPAAHVDRYSHAPARGTARPGAHFTWVRDRSDLAFVIVSWARQRRVP